jgi:hypothetical protein
MTWKDLGTKLDEQVGKGTERITRRITRRDALRTAMLTGVATVGAIALGQRPALASVRCGPPCGPSSFCSGCPGLGCPSGMRLCKNNCKVGTSRLCDHGNGHWIYCTGYGRCGQGYTICQDCHTEGQCNVCICLSAVQCADCCSATDVMAQQQRLLDMAAAN